MPDCLNSPFLSKIEHTITAGAQRESGREVLGYAKCTERIGVVGYHLLSLLIKNFFRIREEPVHAIGDTWGCLDIFEEGECRQAYTEIVPHSILHLLEQIGILCIFCLEVYLVLKGCIVVECKRLIPLLLSHSLLLSERIDPVHSEGKVRECDSV